MLESTVRKARPGRKAAVVVVVSAATVGAIVGTVGLGAASADPPGGINGHNCAGVIVSDIAAPGLGAQVAALAHEQAIDNFGIADCGQDHRNNP